MTGQAARWGDLRRRILSAVVLVAVGGLAIAMGGWAFAALVVLAVAAMVWELTRLAAAPAPLAQGLLAGVALTAALVAGGPVTAVLLVPAVVLAVTADRLRWPAAGYAVLILMAGHVLVGLRLQGVAVLLWLVAVVVTSDVLGYFAGRLLGGPRFWPAISPKKTWSGTVAGWIGAALVGAGFAAWVGGGWWLVLLSPPVAFAGQLGDIVESALKRRAGVKDSSNLIPGHGGALDRFDALLLAAVIAGGFAPLLAGLGG